jgi:hypothetical protein
MSKRNKIQIYDQPIREQLEQIAKDQNRSVNYIGCRLLEKALKDYSKKL